MLLQTLYYYCCKYYNNLKIYGKILFNVIRPLIFEYKSNDAECIFWNIWVHCTYIYGFFFCSIEKSSKYRRRLPLMTVYMNNTAAQYTSFKTTSGPYYFNMNSRRGKTLHFTTKRTRHSIATAIRTKVLSKSAMSSQKLRHIEIHTSMWSIDPRFDIFVNRLLVVVSQRSCHSLHSFAFPFYVFQPLLVTLCGMLWLLYWNSANF